MAGIEARRADPAQASAGPLLVVLGVVVAVVMALPAADVLARMIAGQRGSALRWPPNPLATAWGVVVGDPSMGYASSGLLAGMTSMTGSAGSAGAPVAPVDPTLVRCVAVVLEVAVLVLLVVVWRRFGHLLGSGGGHTGFATPRQARDVLGVGTLSRRRREIRPDLTGGPRSGPLGGMVAGLVADVLGRGGAR